MNDKIDEVTSKKARNEKLVAENEKNIEKLLRINDDLKGQQEEVRAQVRERVNSIRDAEQNVSENKKRIIGLEARLNDRKKVNEKLKNDIVASQGDQEAEIEKGAKLANRIRKLEGDIDERDQELGELRAHVAELRKEQIGLLEINDALVNDIKVSNRHLDVLTVQNYNVSIIG